LLAVERQGGYSRESPLVMWNPPWVLPLLMPLAVFPYATTQKLWLGLGCACIALSIFLLWRLYGHNRFPSPLACFLIAIFTPSLVVLAIGQIGPLLVLGITCFLWFERKQNHLLAGACLFLLALKPHLAFLFCIALGFCVMRQRQWRLLAGFFATAILVLAVTLACAPQVFSQYRTFWSHNPVRWSEFPTLSGILSHISGNEIVIPALLPVLASVWLLQHWMRFRQRWSWQTELPVILLVSLAASPYAWFFDGVILLPALVQSLSSPWKRTCIGPLIGYTATNILCVILIATGKSLFWYSWVAPMWLLLYLWQNRPRTIPQS